MKIINTSFIHFIILVQVSTQSYAKAGLRGSSAGSLVHRNSENSPIATEFFSRSLKERKENQHSRESDRDRVDSENSKDAISSVGSHDSVDEDQYTKKSFHSKSSDSEDEKYYPEGLDQPKKSSDSKNSVYPLKDAKHYYEDKNKKSYDSDDEDYMSSSFYSEDSSDSSDESRDEDYESSSSYSKGSNDSSDDSRDDEEYYIGEPSKIEFKFGKGPCFALNEADDGEKLQAGDCSDAPKFVYSDKHFLQPEDDEDFCLKAYDDKIILDECDDDDEQQKWYFVKVQYKGKYYYRISTFDNEHYIQIDSKGKDIDIVEGTDNLERQLIEDVPQTFFI